VPSEAGGEAELGRQDEEREGGDARRGGDLGGGDGDSPCGQDQRVGAEHRDREAEAQRQARPGQVVAAGGA
jgi:hypothetical protein